PDHYRMYQPNGALLFLANEYVVVDPSGMPQFRFDALWAQPAGLGEIVVEALPTDEAIVKNGPIQPGDVLPANIYLVSISTRTVSFVATTSWALNTPLSATSDIVAWTDAYCIVPPGRGHMRLY